MTPLQPTRAGAGSQRALVLLLALLGWAAFTAAGCGRSSLLGNGGVDEDACFGPDCPAPPDAGGDGGRDGGPDLGDMGPGDGPPCGLAYEICGNGVDDDCNGLVDCKDPGCAGSPQCGTPGMEICNNGLDDDDDGLIDCKDPDCATFPGCQPHMCDPVKPNCADPACVDDPRCQNLVCKPTVDFGHLAPKDSTSTRNLDTRGTRDVTLTPCAQSGGGMVVTEFWLDTALSSVRLDYTQSLGADHVFALFRAGVNQACNANWIACYKKEPYDRSGTTTWVLQPGHYYLIVQVNAAPRNQGTIEVTLSTPTSQKKEVCNNGVDDDKNGLIDCADPACLTDPSCKNNECVPDLNVGAIVAGTPGKDATISTVGKPSNYSLTCGGKGDNFAIQFSLKETAGIRLDFDEISGDHVIDLFRKPPAGLACDAQPVAKDSCFTPSAPSESVAWGEYPPGEYLFIFKAIKPGDEGEIDVRISAYKNKGVELCHDGIDDDGNGLTDCLDPACFGDPGCGPPVCSPDVDLGTFHVGDQRTTTQNLATGVPNLKVPCAQGGGRSRVIQLTLAEHAGIGVNCTQSDGHAVLDLVSAAGPRQSCDANQMSCADPEVIPFGCNFIFPNLQAGTYYVILQAFKPGQEGKVTITLSAVEDRILEICDNKIDDDMDGFTDCADKKCAASAYCAMRACKADATIDPLPLDGTLASRTLSTSGQAARAAAPCATKPGGGTAVLELNVPAQATIKVGWVQGFVTNNDLVLYPKLGDGLICDAAKPIACVPTKAQMIGNTTFANVPAGRYWLAAVADQPGAEGTIILGLTASP